MGPISAAEGFCAFGRESEGTRVGAPVGGDLCLKLEHQVSDVGCLFAIGAVEAVAAGGGFERDHFGYGEAKVVEWLLLDGLVHDWSR